MLKEMDLYTQIALIAIIVGGLCWGIVGLFNFYLVTGILGNLLGRIVYVIVGVAAGWLCYKIYVEKTTKI